MTQSHVRGDNLRSPRGLKKILLGTAIASSVGMQGCMPLAIGYAGHQIRRGNEEAARILADSGYRSGDNFYNQTPSAPKMITFSSAPLRQFYPAYFGLQEDTSMSCVGTLSLHPEGVQFVSDRGSYAAILDYRDLTRIQAKEGVLFGDDQIIFHFAGQKYNRMNLWIKKKNDVTAIANWIATQKNPKVLVSR